MIKKNHLLIIIPFFVVVHILLYYHYGLRVFFDSAAYLEAADYIIAHGELQDFHHLFYIVPIVVMTVFRWLFPGEVFPILLFQCALSVLATISLYKSSEKVLNSRTAGLMTALIFIVWLDNIHWNITTMTESIACSLYCFTLYKLVHWRNRRQDILMMSVLLILVFFTRPTGIVIIISSFVFFIAFYWQPLLQRRSVLIGGALAATVVMIIGAERMLDHWNFSDEYLKGNIITYADVVKEGPLFHESLSIDPPASTEFARSDSPLGRVAEFIADNPVHFLKAATLKTFYLIAFIRPYYSGTHNLYLVIWMVSIYSLCVLGWRSAPNLPIKLFVLSAIVVNCGLIAISSVDWDNRFYIPMEPGIVVLAGGGAAFLIERIKKAAVSRHAA